MIHKSIDVIKIPNMCVCADVSVQQINGNKTLIIRAEAGEMSERYLNRWRLGPRVEETQLLVLRKQKQNDIILAWETEAQRKTLLLIIQQH